MSMSKHKKRRGNETRGILICHGPRINRNVTLSTSMFNPSRTG